MLTHEQTVEIDLCDICTKAVRQFLKERYNNAKKGQNTGLTFHSDGTFNYAYTPLQWSQVTQTDPQNTINFTYPGSNDTGLKEMIKQRDKNQKAISKALDENIKRNKKKNSNNKKANNKCKL